jgi:hypothetical protein
MAIPRSGEIQHLALNYSKQQIGNMVLQGMITPDVGTLAISRIEKMSTPPAVAPTQTVASQKLNPNAGNPGIAGLESAPRQVVQALQSLPPQGGQMPEAPPVQMAEGGLTYLPIRDDMFDEQSYAGGGIVSFAKGGKTDPSAYDPWYYSEPEAVLAPVPKEKTLDDAAIEMQAAQQQFGYDPTLLDRIAKEERAINQKDMSDLDKMNQVKILNAAARGFLKPGGFMRGATEAVIEAGGEAATGMKAKKDLEKLNRQMELSIAKEKNALARGDAATAQKAVEERQNIVYNIQSKNAELVNASNIAKTKAGSTAGKTAIDLRNKAATIAEKMFTNTYPAGSATTVLGDDPGLIQFARNVYLKNALQFLKTEVEPPIPSATQLRTMYDEYLTSTGRKPGTSTTKPGTSTTKPTTTAKPAAKLSGPDSLLNIPRPANIQKIMDKAAANKNPNKKYITENTDEELIPHGI